MHCAAEIWRRALVLSLPICLFMILQLCPVGKCGLFIGCLFLNLRAGLLALAVLPMAGILDTKQVAQSVGNELILLLMGGFMLSRALEASGAHRRLAYAMVNAVGGGSGRSLIIGFTFATAFISMWISNTATTLIMLPVGFLGVIQYYKMGHVDYTVVIVLAPHVVDGAVIFSEAIIIRVERNNRQINFIIIL